MSDKPDQMDQEARELINTLDDPVLAVEARSVQAMSAMDDLKNEVLGFFKDRMLAIRRAEQIKDLVFQQFEEMIPGGTLTFDQLMTIARQMAHETGDSADSIISMFRPASNGSGSLLIDIANSGNDKSEIAKAFANYSPEELRRIDQTFRVIRDIVENGQTPEIKGVDHDN